jgi:hypothetical protein
VDGTAIVSVKCAYGKRADEGGAETGNENGGDKEVS